MLRTLWTNAPLPTRRTLRGWRAKARPACGLAALLCLAAAGPARAATLDGLTLADTYPVQGQTLVLNGMAIRTLSIFHVRVYVAGLYLAQKARDSRAILDSATPKVVLLQFLHTASKADIEKQYREGEQKNCGHGECAPADAADFERLIAATPAFAVGDTLTYVFTAQGMRVLANNKSLGDFANPDLSRRMLASFIGPYPPSEDLKAHLLGTAQ